MSNNALTPQELGKEIQNDVKGTFEKDLEKEAMNAINRLKREWKMSQEEIVKLYRTNFKNLLQVNVNTSDILVQKIKDINSVTRKLLAVQFSKNTKTKESSSWFSDQVKSVAYGLASIDNNINKNSVTKNIIKWIIDEIMSLPEMIEAILTLPGGPIKFFEGLIALFKWETWKKMRDEMSNVWLNTPQQQYQTGRTGMMAVLMLLPWGIGKTLLNIWKKAGKLVVKTTKSVVKDGFKETWKKALSATGKEVKSVVAKTKESIKNTKESVSNTVKESFEYPKAKINNLKAKDRVAKVTKELQTLWDDITVKQAELLKTQNWLKMKNLKPDIIAEQQAKIKNLQKEIADLTKSKKELDKTLKSAKKEVSSTNTKIGIDNNKIGIKKRYETNAKKVWDDILKKEEQIWQLKNSLKTRKDPRINAQISKLEKEISDSTKKYNDLLDKAKNYDIRIIKTPRESIRKIIIEKLKTIKWVNIDKLKALKNSPHRLSLVKDLDSLRTLNSKIKRLTESNKSLESTLIKKRKNWKTALENAKINPKFWQNNNILKNENILKSQTKGIEVLKNMQKDIKQKVYNQLTWLWVITLANIQDLNNETIYNISEYLYEDNDQFINHDFNKTWLESWSSIIESLDTSSLDAMSSVELQSMHITLTGLASKSWSLITNQALATRRAENAKDILLKQYPSLNPTNIKINISVQPNDSVDDPNQRQGVKINTKTNNLAYVDGYSDLKWDSWVA